MSEQEDFVGVPSAFTDLAVEATELLRGQGRREIPGVEVHEERRGDITITRVRILDDQGERLMGKAKGSYITIEAPGLRKRNWELQQDVGKAITSEVTALYGNGHRPSSFLVVGLGNWRATADSLGPKVVSHILVTRHLRDYVPEDLRGKLARVSAVAPGVLGITGIETGEIVKGIVERSSPEAVVAIDALAARSVERISTTVQLADTGIHPGSGVGNRRPGLTRETLGVPVLAIGIPTVVHAMTIVDNALSAVAERLPAGAQLRHLFYGMDAASRIETLTSVMSDSMGDLVVTPKEIDTYISDMAKVVAGALNDAFHPGLDLTEFTRFLS